MDMGHTAILREQKKNNKKKHKIIEKALFQKKTLFNTNF